MPLASSTATTEELPRRLRALRALWCRPLLVELVLVFGLTGVAAGLFSRILRTGANYDEGVYLASVDALAHGQKLGSEVFASQPPGLYVLLEAERAIFGGSLVAMRVGMLLLALVGCLSAYYVGRSLAGLSGGLLAMALLVASRGVEEESVRVRADLPSVSLSLLAIALVLFAVRRNGAVGIAAAALAGGALAAAVSVKLLAATAVVPVVSILLRGTRRSAAAFTAGVAVITAALGGFYADVIGALWNDSIRFHLHAQSAHIEGAPRSLSGNFAKIVSTVTDFHGPMSPFLWLVAVGAVGALVGWRGRRLVGTAPLWLWVGVSLLFLVWHRPLWGHDVVMLTAALAVASGIGLAALLADRRLASSAVGAACVLVVAATLADHSQASSPGENPGISWAAAVLRARTPAGSEVASDLPIVPFLAGRRQPGDLVDTSGTRVGSGWLTQREVIRSIERDPLSAVVIGHELLSERRVLRFVRSRFPKSVSRAGVALYGEKPVVLRIYFRAG